MIDRIHDRINDYSGVTVHLASPNDIRSWSYGETKKPETINYRTYRAEKDGLFCERIFGPERDWECACGKYKGIKYKDIMCDRCSVKITHSKVRRTRMGHINLAAPIVHIWFFKAMPSRLANLLGIKTTSLQQVVYFQRYIVTDPGDTPLVLMELLTEEMYRELRAEYGDGFKADMGADAVRTLLRNLDLKTLSVELREGIKNSRSAQKTETYVKRLRVVEAFRNSANSPEWTVMDVIPVIPPDLRPLVPLESGNFATSDLNDLYRRVINRNNRLKKLLDLNAPGVIIRNEKRMLQQAVDALFDNGRCKRSVLGTGNRPLKSLTDMIKGKQGRFRENLLGKRVDYSARSVIVVGPELKLHQCGLPKKIALELFQPFIIRRLREQGFADTIKSAKKILERKDDEVWDVLEEVIKGVPVMLNRAPTLHRMGIQAFYPVLVEGDSIMIHPLVCAGFNADFDGDQMAVHLPLSLEAQTEASMLMLATNNIFSPAHGNPIISADLDIVLGCYFLTTVAHAGSGKGEGMTFANLHECLMAWEEGKIDLRSKVKVRLGPDVEVLGPDGPETSPNGVYETSAGRVLFFESLPHGMPFSNLPMKKKSLNQIISQCHERLGRPATIKMLDTIKTMGFHWATISGLSFASDDLKVPPNKGTLIAQTEKEVMRIEKDYKRGVITDGERYNQVIDAWTQVREQVWGELMEELAGDIRKDDPHYVNPIHMMVDSGARGSMQQIGQLAGMRGLMAKPSGKVIETPIIANFKEGLRGFEYFSSTHGARKGLADTALKTANSGYLTRKLVEVAQDVVITREDCGTDQGISKAVLYRGDQVELSLTDAIRGRTARDNIVDLITDEKIIGENGIITAAIAQKIEEMGYTKLRVRSPLTCEADFGICAKCYGMDLSTGHEVEIGTAIGVIAAQSVGEPGTQLTMRTFHIGGIGIRALQESDIKSKVVGTVRFTNLRCVTNDNGEQVVLNRQSEMIIEDDRNRELDRYTIPLGSTLRVAEGKKVKERQILAEWDPHMTPILSDMAGIVRYEGIMEGVTMRREVDPNTGFERRVIIEHRGDHHPQIVITDEKGNTVGMYPVPEKAHIEVAEGQKMKAGTLLARTPREVMASQDITGGLPRVTELFEARKPKDSAIMAELDGIVEFGERKRGKRTIIIKSHGGQFETEHLIPQGKHVLVHRGDRVKAGDRLADGPLVPHDILRICGEERLQDYLLREVQAVYRSQNVQINDKHIETLIRQMMRKVVIEDPGDTNFLPMDTVSKVVFKSKNQEVIANNGKPAVARTQLLGIAKASLQSDSFVAAASFQETTKVLTEAAIGGRRDELRGLKENVILGHIIPAGTGFHLFNRAVVGYAEPASEITGEEAKELADPKKPAELEVAAASD